MNHARDKAISIVQGFLESKRFKANALVESNQFSLLNEAVLRDNVEVVRLLLQMGAHADTRSKNSNTPLHLCMTGYNEDKAIEIAELLLAAGANVSAWNYSNHTPLMIADEKGKTKIATYLRRRGAQK